MTWNIFPHWHLMWIINIMNLSRIFLKLCSLQVCCIHHYKHTYPEFLLVFTPQPLRAVRVLFSPMVSGWAGGKAAGKSLSGLYLRNRKV